MVPGLQGVVCHQAPPASSFTVVPPGSKLDAHRRLLFLFLLDLEEAEEEEEEEEEGEEGEEGEEEEEAP